LIDFVCDTIFDFGTKHHLVAAHKVEHNILKSWLEGFWINKIKVNLIISSNLNPLISFDEENESSPVENIVLLPFLDGLVFLVHHLFEEQDLTRASGDQCSAVN
jgi:hypothetical protein